MENNKRTDANNWVDERMGVLGPEGEWQPDTAGALAAFRTRTARMTTGGQKFAWATLVVTAAAAALLAHPASRVFAERCIDACRNLFTGDDSPGEVRVSEMAPNFALQDDKGNTHRLSDYRGKVVLLNFWASWCPPCREEIPLLQAFARTYADRGFEVVGIAMDEEGWKSIKPFMKELQVGYLVVLGDEHIAKEYGVGNLPVSFLIDREGRVTGRYEGVVTSERVHDAFSLLFTRKPQ
jgi:cytochrome c biogenesis protein CcmG/thiol:disulfide interchange protein DsbE